MLNGMVGSETDPDLTRTSAVTLLLYTDISIIPIRLYPEEKLKKISENWFNPSMKEQATKGIA